MDRCALFVDAGYALGDGALAVHGTRHRDSVSWDYAGLLKLLGGMARDRTGLPLLRCYWYDVAPTPSRAAEHDSVGDLPGVKLRLSKARPSRKEGVEAEMRRDLMALARNRAVSDVIIVSTEEDLAPAIAEVQEFGVRTVLLHIDADGSWAAARALRQECDDVIEVSAGHLRPFVELIAGAEPRVSSSGYRELVSPGQVSVPQPVLDASAPRLFASSAPAGYERAPQLTAAGGQGGDQRDLMASADAASFGLAGHGDDPRASAQRGQDGQHAQPQSIPLAPAAQYQSGDALASGLPAAETGFAQAYNGQDMPIATNGHGGGQHGAVQSHLAGQVGLAGQGSMASGLPQVAPGMPRHAGAAPGNGMPPNGMPASSAPAGMPGPGHAAEHGRQADGVNQAVVPPGSALPGGPNQPTQAGGVPQSGFAAAGQGIPGQQGAVQPQHGSQPPSQALAQQNFAEPPQSAGQQNFAQPPQSAAQHSLGQQPGQALAVPPGAHRQTGALQSQNGLMPVDPQRPPLAGRQLPAGNGMPYGQDRGMPYPDQLQQPQLAAQPGQPYAAGGYGAPQPQVPQLPVLALSVGDAVQSAHAEGFGFGEAVARDAPALWLEAVLARKPRMPSDLEARLLQGSALPIDSLLHDEVRHALRRGFWDALERSRH